MTNKLIIEEIRRIQEVMYGYDIITEAVGANKFMDLILALIKMSKSVDDGKFATGITERLNKYVASLGRVGRKTKKYPDGVPITDFRKLTQVGDLKGVVKFLTGDVKLQSTILAAIRRDYKTDLLTQGDVGYEIQKFVDTLEDSSLDILKALDDDFVTDYTKLMDELGNPSGLIKSLAKMTAADFKNAWLIMSNSEHADMTAKYLDSMPGTFKRMVVRDIKSIFASPFKALRWLVTGSGTFGDKIVPLKVLYRITKQLLTITAVVMAGETLEYFFTKSNSLLDDDGELYGSLPPEVKEIFCLPEETATAEAQKLWNELQKNNPNEETIKNILTQNGEGSKLIANQIAYFFDKLADNKGDLTLMEIMDDNMTWYIDKIPSAANRLLHIPTTSAWYLSWTASDILAALNAETFPAVNAPMLNLTGQMEVIARGGIEAVAGYAAFRIKLPKPVNNNTQALYSRFGMYLNPKQFMWLQEKMDSKGMIDENSSVPAFITALNKTTKDDYTNQDTGTGLVIVDGKWENGVFTPEDENAVEGVSYNCSGAVDGGTGDCKKVMDETGDFKTQAACVFECETRSTYDNEEEIRAEVELLQEEVESVFENLFLQSN